MQSNAIQEISDLDFHVEIKMTLILSKTVTYGSSYDTYVISVLHNKQVPLCVRILCLSYPSI